MPNEITTIHVSIAGEITADARIFIGDPNEILIQDFRLMIANTRSLDLYVHGAAGQNIVQVQWRSSPDTEDPEVEIVVASILLKGRTLIERRRFKAGVMNDGPAGEPAIETFDDSGRIKSRRFYSNGVLQDGRNGEPGWTDYHRDSDRPYLVQRFLAEELHDGPNGEPAYLQLEEDGTIVDEGHYRRGVEITPSAPQASHSPDPAIARRPRARRTPSSRKGGMAPKEPG